MFVRAFATVVAALAVVAPVLGGRGGERPPAEPPVEAAAAVKPPVFSDKSYADALAANKTDGKLFIVKATASWCLPCKAMDRTTFVDPRVVAWFALGEKGNGTVIDFDVDKEKELAQSLGIRAMPTIIAYKAGKEFDRVVGMKPADAFLEWLEAVKAGKKFGDDLEIKVEKANAGQGKVSVRERLDNARLLLNKPGDGAFEKATDEYLWLWQNIVKEEPSMVGVRGSFMAGEIQKLIENHAPAKEKFARVRDDAWAAYLAEPSQQEPLDDWLVLNEALGDRDRTLEWFDRAKVEPKSGKTLERVGYRLERMLAERGRVADICLLYPDPIAKLRSENALRQHMPRMADEEQTRSIQAIHEKMFRDRASTLYTSLLLAKRDNDAAKFAAEALKLDDTGAMRAALVRTAVENGAGRKDHHQWVDRADKDGEATDDLRARLEQQAGKK